MSDNIIKNVVSKIELSENSKKKIKASLAERESEKKIGILGMRIGARVAIAAAILTALGVTAYAMSGLMNFSFTRDDDTVIIGASLSDEEKEQIKTEPVRAWNPGDGEISVKLEFAYMPEDMSERDNTPAKWYGTAEDNRNITFSGFDLRRGDFNEAINGAGDAERFAAGENDAYLVYTGKEISVYDKELYVLFHDGQFVVKAIVGRGITADEIKMIAAGMTVVETDDTEHALPISNEFGDSDDDNIPEVIVGSLKTVYENELLHNGDSAEIRSSFNNPLKVTVEGMEIRDTIAGLSGDAFVRDDVFDQFVNENGEFIPYKRTEVDYEAGTFGENVEMTKRMVLVTVRVDGEYDEIHEVEATLNSFDLAGLVCHDDGTVTATQYLKGYVVDSTPGKIACRHDIMYRENLGDGRWVVGYLLDEEECTGDMFYYCPTYNVYYSLEK